MFILINLDCVVIGIRPHVFPLDRWNFVKGMPPFVKAHDFLGIPPERQAIVSPGIQTGLTHSTFLVRELV
jgi:hypothetical protein